MTLNFLFGATYGKKNKWFANVGPLVSYRLRSNSAKSTSFYNFGFGATSGLGLQIPISTKVLLVSEIRNNIQINLDQYTGGRFYTLDFIFGLSYKL